MYLPSNSSPSNDDNRRRALIESMKHGRPGSKLMKRPTSGIGNPRARGGFGAPLPALGFNPYRAQRGLGIGGLMGPSIGGAIPNPQGQGEPQAPPAPAAPGAPGAASEPAPYTPETAPYTPAPVPYTPGLDPEGINPAAGNEPQYNFPINNQGYATDVDPFPSKFWDGYNAQKTPWWLSGYRSGLGTQEF